ALERGRFLATRVEDGVANLLPRAVRVLESCAHDVGEHAGIAPAHLDRHGRVLARLDRLDGVHDVPRHDAAATQGNQPLDRHHGRDQAAEHERVEDRSGFRDHFEHVWNSPETERWLRWAWTNGLMA